MTRCPAHVPMDTPMLRGSVTPGYSCDGQRGHTGHHAAHEIGLSWREADEAGLILCWEDGDEKAVSAHYYVPLDAREPSTVEATSGAKR